MHGFILTPSFGTQIDTVSRILLQDVAPSNPFYKYIQKVRELGITQGADPTSCYEFGQLRGSLSVSRGVPFSTPQREVARNAFGALLTEQHCTSGFPTVPVTVPHIFARKSEIETGGQRSSAALGSTAKRGKLKITKTRTKTSVRVKVSKLKRGGTLRFTVVAKKLPGGKPVPVTTQVR